MKCVFVQACAVALTLTSCKFTSADDQTTETGQSEASPQQSSSRTAEVSRAAEHVGAPVELYEEVKRLNSACEQAGGGVSGSPDCDASNVKEEQLKKLGYCIDYPNSEKLTRCDDVSWPKSNAASLLSYIGGERQTATLAGEIGSRSLSVIAAGNTKLGGRTQADCELRVAEIGGEWRLVPFSNDTMEVDAHDLRGVRFSLTNAGPRSLRIDTDYGERLCAAGISFTATYRR